jgi:hypothetical protein
MEIRELREIAEQVVEIRRDWDLGAVLNVLMGLRDRGDLGEMAVAAVRAASDKNSRAPAAIGFNQYWTAPVKPGKDKATVTYVVADPLPECATCGAPRMRMDRHGGAVPPPKVCGQCGQPWRDRWFKPDFAAEREAAVPMPPWFREVVADTMRNLGKLPGDV